MIGDLCPKSRCTFSDNLTSQETTTQDALSMGPDGAELSCPGSRMVADSESEDVKFETTDTPETIGPDLTASVLSQSFTKTSGR